MNITLIGMPGVGKSFYGKLLAQKIGYAFLDTDTFIEKREGKRISELITEKGEEAFLTLEGKHIGSLSPQENTIIATGGSVIYAEQAMHQLRSLGILVYLSVPLETLKQRVQKRTEGNEQHIIGLKEQGWQALLTERAKLYEQYATIIVSLSESASEEENTSQILKEIQAKIPKGL